uniref:Uncharacterized protein n=1 Tax=Amphimedon queenslandica TaxID=400682 RepID=A0A1X7T1V3_AMPQE
MTIQIAINTCNQNLKELFFKKFKLVYKSLASVLSINPLDISSLFQLEPINDNIKFLTQTYC